MNRTGLNPKSRPNERGIGLDGYADSGAPVFNQYGNLIGLNKGKYGTDGNEQPAATNIMQAENWFQYYMDEDHAVSDWDNDGFRNTDDNCPGIPSGVPQSLYHDYNPLQIDIDNDGRGMECDDAIVVSGYTPETLNQFTLWADSTVLFNDRVFISDGEILESWEARDKGYNIWGGNRVEVGSDAHPHSILAGPGGVWLRDRCSVYGSVITEGNIDTQNATVVSNLSRPQHPDIDLPVLTSFYNTASVGFPVSTGSNLNVYSNLPQSLLCGISQKKVHVYSGGTLSLWQCGNYYMDELTVEPGGIIVVPESQFCEEGTRIFIRNKLTFRGVIQDLAGKTPASDSLLWVTFGTYTVWIEKPLIGTVIAPNATIQIQGAPMELEGSFYAKNIVVHQDNHLSPAHFRSSWLP